MPFGILSTFAFAAGTIAFAESNEGCCFSIGYGDLMRPCCLQTVPNVTTSSCAVGNRIGGATGFGEGACPNTAEEAHKFLQPANLDETTLGCCFSIGFGAYMRPCCLETQPNVELSACHVEGRDGGATGFREGSCPLTAEEASQAMQPVASEQESQGCCFSVGFGDGMHPCCLETNPNVGLSSCSVGSRIGGATGFSQGGCPNTAEEAQRAIQAVALEEEPQVFHEMPHGCCFSFGFGDFMRPCCLQTSPNVELSACDVESRRGGATGFREGSCPLTAEEAHQAVQPAVLEESQGCCFSIGFGDHMQPCCLETTSNVGLSSCHAANRMGGATGFTEGGCPTTAEEAHESLQHSQSAKAHHPVTNLLMSTRQHERTSSALPLAMVACVSFAAGSLISVVVMMYRWQNRDDGDVFMPLDA